MHKKKERDSLIVDPHRHPDAVYKSHAGLESHLRRKHLNSFPESQLPTIVKIGETTTVDKRSICPICYAPADIEGLGDFHNHIANHLERIATFALPNGTGDDSNGASSVASRGRSASSDSRNLSSLSSHSDIWAEDLEVAATGDLQSSQDEPVPSAPTKLGTLGNCGCFHNIIAINQNHTMGLV